MAHGDAMVYDTVEAQWRDFFSRAINGPVTGLQIKWVLKHPSKCCFGATYCAFLSFKGRWKLGELRLVGVTI